jgi:hypothetical protein
VNAVESCPKETEVLDVCAERGKDGKTVMRKTRESEYFINYAEDT